MTAQPPLPESRRPHTKKTAPSWAPSFVLTAAATLVMEARGIEPRSEIRSTTASTCVVHRLRSPAAGQWTAHCWTSLLELRPLPEDAAADYPDFAIPDESPREGSPPGRCITRSYAARAKLELAVVNRPEGFTRTRVPGHAATASPTPSKPVAPVAKKPSLETPPSQSRKSRTFTSRRDG